MKRLLLAALVGVCIAAAPAVVLPGHSAQAAGLDLQCVGSVDLRFSPGLTNTPQTVEVFYDSTLTCPLAPLKVTGGSGFGLFTIPGASCTDLAMASHAVTYNWFPLASSSTVNYSAASVNLQSVSQMVQIGSVGAGMLSGDQAHSAITFLNLNLAACGTSTGLTILSGSEVLNFVSL